MGDNYLEMVFIGKTVLLFESFSSFLDTVYETKNKLLVFRHPIRSNLPSQTIDSVKSVHNVCAVEPEQGYFKLRSRSCPGQNPKILTIIK